MKTPIVYPQPLAQASQFEAWFEIATKWRAGKNYRWKAPRKEEKFDKGKGELLGHLTPPATPSKSKPLSPLDYSKAAPVCPFTPTLTLPASESSPPASPALNPLKAATPCESLVAADSDPTSSQDTDLPSPIKSRALSAPLHLSPPLSLSLSSSREQIPLFENECFAVKHSPKGGLGCFAKTDIKKGAIIHSEEPLFVANALQIFHHYEQLTAEQQAAYLRLHGWHGLASHKIIAIFQTNRFHISGGKCGIFLNSSRFNHACPGFRNCGYAFDQEANKLVFTTLADIKKDVEITIAYANLPNHLYQHYGFFCDCPGCPSRELQYREWKFEDNLLKNQAIDRGANVDIDKPTYPVYDSWENDVYNW